MLDPGLRTAQGYTVEKAAADWLEEGLPGRTAKTVEANRDSLRPLQKGHNCLTRAVRHAEGAGSGPAERLGAGRHARGLEGRPSQSLTLAEASALLETLQVRRERQAAERALAGELWQEHGLVLKTSVGTGYQSHNLRRDSRRVTAAAGLGARWVPKELRTSFVSMMSYQGVPVEEIARLAGHASSRTTEVIYRRELRPEITTGAEVMDQIFRPKLRRGSTTAAG